MTLLCGVRGQDECLPLEAGDWKRELKEALGFLSISVSLGAGNIDVFTS